MFNPLTSSSIALAEKSDVNSGGESERKMIKYSTQSMHFSSEFDVVTCPSLNRSLGSEMAFSDIASWPEVGRCRNTEKCVLATVQ